MSPLPPSDRRKPVAYGSYDKLCDIPRVEILPRHCHAWTEKQVEQVQCVSCLAFTFHFALKNIKFAKTMINLYSIIN